MNISNIHNCYGCGVCAKACGKHIIGIELNQWGFYEPRISDLSLCTECGLCVDACSYSHDELSIKSTPLKSFAAWSKNETHRMVCSSGGVGLEIALKAIDKGYKVCTVKYNTESQRAEHYIAEKEEDLIPSVGSKYIQSYTVDAFLQINRKEKYLVVGTPCQIDSFRRYTQRLKIEENFIFMDFYCHGVPSMNVWKKYLEMIEKKTVEPTFVSWRNKETGWHDSWAIMIDNKKLVDWHDSYKLLIGEKKGCINSRRSQGDLFYKYFLNDTCLGEACYDKCKFKYDKSAADIRIGDLWGPTYQNEEKGVSALVAFTEKGLNWINKIDINKIEHPFEIVAEGQMKECPAKTKYHKLITKWFADDCLDIHFIDERFRNRKKRDWRLYLVKHPKSLLRTFFSRFKI